jgi:predicted RNase H-like HicB family nuclease
MRHQYPYTAYFVEGDEGWVVAFAAEHSNVITQGRTIEEARERLRAAVTAMIEESQELARELVEGRHVLLIEPQMTEPPK